MFVEATGEYWRCGLIDGPCTIDALDREVFDEAHGAIAQFLGMVRNHNAGLPAVAVDYDVHPELAMKALTQLCDELCGKFPIRLFMQHSRGLVQVGEASVVIAASSAHRRDALAAVSEAIDLLKVRVPIWKREIGPDATARWLDGHSLRKDEE